MGDDAIISLEITNVEKSRDCPVGEWFQCVQKRRPWREGMGLSDMGREL